MRNECPSCLVRFGGMTAFDRHRTGPFGTPSGRRCMSPDEMQKVGLKEGPDGYWSRPAPAAVAARSVSGTALETASAT